MPEVLSSVAAEHGEYIVPSIFSIFYSDATDIREMKEHT